MGHVGEDREGLGQPMNGPTLLINPDKGRHPATHRPQVLGQLEDLLKRLKVAFEEDEAAEPPLLIEAQDLLRNFGPVEADDDALTDAALQVAQF